MTSLFKYLHYKMASASVCMSVCVLVGRNQARNFACCVLRVSLMYACRRAYGLTYKMATFIAAKGVIQYGL